MLKVVEIVLLEVEECFSWTLSPVFLPAPVRLPASQPDACHRASGQGQQPRSHHIQRLWWRRAWTWGNISTIVKVLSPVKADQQEKWLFFPEFFCPFPPFLKICPHVSSAGYSLSSSHFPSEVISSLLTSFPSFMWLIFCFLSPLFSFFPCIFSVFLLHFPDFSILIFFLLLDSSFLHLLLHSSSLPCFPLVFSSPPLLLPAQFKYRGHFLPISPGARRAPCFAARRKVLMSGAVMSF